MWRDVENSEESNREKEQIRLLKKEMDGLSSHHPLVDEIQNDIENDNPSTKENSMKNKKNQPMQ